jgi:hypothetical protein
VSVRIARSIDDLKKGQTLLTKSPALGWTEQTQETWELDDPDDLVWVFDNESVIILADPKPEPAPVGKDALENLIEVFGDGIYGGRWSGPLALAVEGLLESAEALR